MKLGGWLAAPTGLYRVAWVASGLLMGGCVNLAPDYQLPAPAVPTGGAPAVVGAVVDSVVDSDTPELSWRSVYVDERLRRLIERALASNRDLRIAALNVDRARAPYQVQQGRSVPNANFGMSASRSKDVGNQFSASLGLVAYELDFFGRVRNVNEAALQTFLQSEESRRTAQIGLVAEVANAWLALAFDMERRRLAERTLESRKQSYGLTQTRYRLGAIGGLPLTQAQTALEAARAELASLSAQIAQDIAALELLVGAAVSVELLPRADADGVPDVVMLPAVPGGVPSKVLQRRPDVLAAEHALRSTHADIGAARAALFPLISLTTSVGSASSELSKLFQRGSGTWAFGPTLSLPIFDGGAGRAQVRASEVARDIALAQYDKAVQTAFREVADALAVSASLSERLAAQQALVEATQRQLRLAEASYRAGGIGQLELLDAQRSLYSAAQGLLALQQTVQTNRITLYKVLGGGWNGA